MPPRILAPVDRVEEVEPLVAAGAQELYGGVQPEDWLPGDVSANQRTFASAQLPSEGAFAEAAREAQHLGTPLNLALNAPLYDPPAYPSLIALAERAVEWGVSGIIVGDLGLLMHLQSASLPLELTLSTMAASLNRGSVAFFRRFGIDRVVLPRHLTLEEMGAVVKAHPGLAFEAFVLVGGCPNDESHCTFQHASPALRWPCEIPYELSSVGGSRLAGSHPLARWHASWNEADRRLACGLCAIPDLARLGVRYLKIVGRGGPTAAKVANVALVSRVLNGGQEASEGPAAYRERFGRKCHPLTCYFPEPRGAAP